MGEQGLSLSFTLGPQPLAVSSYTGIHMIYWVVPEGIYLSPRMKPTHQSILSATHPSIQFLHEAGFTF